MLTILLYLFETYLAGKTDLLSAQEHILDELEEAGFEEHDIFQALGWFENLIQPRQQQTSAASLQNATMRVYTPEETAVLDSECRGLLCFLETIDILDASTREQVIDHCLRQDVEQISLAQLKWVVLVTLCGQHNSGEHLSVLEKLLLNETQGAIH